MISAWIGRSPTNEDVTHVDGAETSTVASRHVLIKRLHCIRASELAELLIHVVCARTRVVAKPDTKVLNLQRFLFVDLEKNRRARRMHEANAMCDVQWSAFPSACLLRAAWDNADNVLTTFTPMISPLAFLTFFSRLKMSQISMANLAGSIS
jgi:hypothetical protein